MNFLIKDRTQQGRWNHINTTVASQEMRCDILDLLAGLRRLHEITTIRDGPSLQTCIALEHHAVLLLWLNRL